MTKDTKKKAKMPEGVRKRGKTYSYRINIKDEVTGKWGHGIEKSGFRTKSDAKAARIKHLAEISENPELPKKKKSITLEDVYDSFIDIEAKYDRAKSTLKRYDSLFRNHVKPKWGNRRIDKIEPSEFTDYLFQLSATHSNAYIQSIEKFIKLLWKFSHQRRYINTNSALNIKTPKKEIKDKIKTYTQDELDLLEQRFSSTNLITAFKLGRTLGVRVGECFGLLWSDIDWKNRKIRVDKQLVYQDNMPTLKAPKTQSSIRTIPLNNDIYNYLKQLKSQQEKQKKDLGVAYIHTKVAIDKGRKQAKTITDSLDFINVKPNGKLLSVESSKMLGRIAREELGINFKFHNLRHTFASRLAALNVPLASIQATLGHANPKTTFTYTHVTPDMETHLSNILNNSKF